MAQAIANYKEAISMFEQQAAVAPADKKGLLTMFLSMYETSL